MRIPIRVPERELEAVLEAGRSRIAGTPSVDFLRVPNAGPGLAPGIWYACPTPGVQWIDLFDGRIAGIAKGQYVVGIITATRQGLLDAHRDLMLWLTGWNPYDLLNEFEAELRTGFRVGTNMVGSLAAAIATARTALAAAVGLQAQLTALTPLHAFDVGSLIPGSGDDTMPALDALANLRGELPRINWTLTPVRHYDQWLNGWQDQGIYGRVTLVDYQASSATG